MKAPLTSLNRHRHVGLLILRLGVGAIFIVHGVTKLLGGWELLAQVGSVMSVFGIDGGHGGWGLVAALFESVGGLLLVLGCLTRFACLAILTVMGFALLGHWAQGDELAIVLHPLTVVAVMSGLFFTGAGRYSVDAYLTDRDVLEQSQPPSDVIRRRKEPRWAGRAPAAAEATTGTQAP